MPGLTWTLLAMPMLALSMKRKYLGGWIKGYSGVLVFYAILLIGEFLVRAHPINILDWPGAAAAGLLIAPSWPMIDPNNAALVINCALIPLFFYKRWLLTALFAVALLCTYSKAGICAATIICTVLAVYRSEDRWWLGAIVASMTCGIVAAVSHIPATNELWNSTHQRMEIWAVAYQMLSIRPLFGIGLGEFGNVYQFLRTEHGTAGVFAHNDFLQIAIEMGWWSALVFAAMWVSVFLKTCKNNVAAAGVLAAILIQSMLEFQFYVPIVSLLAGLATAYHIHHREAGLK